MFGTAMFQTLASGSDPAAIEATSCSTVLPDVLRDIRSELTARRDEARILVGQIASGENPQDSCSR